jgi:hypothetical protein
VGANYGVPYGSGGKLVSFDQTGHNAIIVPGTAPRP